MFLFQLKPGYMNNNIPLLLPLMVSIIEVEIPRDRVGRVQEVHRQEFIAAQVKTQRPGGPFARVQRHIQQLLSR
jgi:hypothetical protein